MSLGIITGVISGVFGLVMGVFFAVNFMGLGVGGGFSIYAIISTPILNGVIGFVGGILTAIVYNFVAQKVGGIELQLEQVTITPTVK